MSGYTSQDIGQLAADLIAAFAGVTPGTGVTIIGVQQNSDYYVKTNTTHNLVAGFKFISVSNTGDTNGTIDGEIIEPGENVTFPAILNNTYGAKVLDATGTVFKVLTVD